MVLAKSLSQLNLRSSVARDFPAVFAGRTGLGASPQYEERWQFLLPLSDRKNRAKGASPLARPNSDFDRSYAARPVARRAATTELEQQLQAELDVARSTRSENRVRVPLRRAGVRRVARAAELAGSRSFARVGGQRKGLVIGMVEHVEKLRAELGAIAFLELPGLRHREVYVPVRGPTEDAVASVALGTVGRRRKDAAVFNVAAVIQQGRLREIPCYWCCPAYGAWAALRHWFQTVEPTGHGRAGRRQGTPRHRVARKEGLVRIEGLSGTLLCSRTARFR